VNRASSSSITRLGEGYRKGGKDTKKVIDKTVNAAERKGGEGMNPRLLAAKSKSCVRYGKYV